MKNFVRATTALIALLAFAPHAMANCTPEKAFAAASKCKWECPDYRKVPRPQSDEYLKHVASCGEPHHNYFANYFAGTHTLTGRIERADTHTWGDVIIFYPDDKSSAELPVPRHGGGLWFVNDDFARKAFKATKADTKNPCSAALAKITISGLFANIVGDPDGAHDWTILKSVDDIGGYKNYGCGS